MQKKANSKAMKALASLALAGVGGGVAYSLGKELDYNKTEKLLSLASGIGGGLLTPMISKNPVTAAKLALPMMVASELPVAGIRGIRGFAEAQKARSDSLNNPINKYVLPTAAVGTAVSLVPVLMNINRAADRIGDGRSIRVSTSLRRRPNQDSDMKILVARAIERGEKEEEEQSTPIPPENKKSLLQRIFGT